MVTEAEGKRLKISQRRRAFKTTLPSVSIKQSIEVVIPTSRSYPVRVRDEFLA